MIQETRASSILENFVLSPNEELAISERLEFLRQHMTKPRMGQYKIEVLFVGKVSVHAPFTGVMSFHESGNRLHGGGDTKVYVCPGNALKKNGCRAIIPSNFTGSALGVPCPNCKGLWKEAELIGELYGNHTYQNWAELIVRYMRVMNLDCDIYIKMAEQSMHQAAHAETTKRKGSTVIGRGGDVVEKVRRERARRPRIYPLYNIIKDTAAGADLTGRIRAFLGA